MQTFAKIGHSSNLINKTMETTAQKHEKEGLHDFQNAEL